jgi:hypothetical protein
MLLTSPDPLQVRSYIIHPTLVELAGVVVVVGVIASFGIFSYGRIRSRRQRKHACEEFAALKPTVQRLNRDGERIRFTLSPPYEDGRPRIARHFGSLYVEMTFNNRSLETEPHLELLQNAKQERGDSTSQGGSLSLGKIGFEVGKQTETSRSVEALSGFRFDPPDQIHFYILLSLLRPDSETDPEFSWELYDLKWIEGMESQAQEEIPVTLYVRGDKQDGIQLFQGILTIPPRKKDPPSTPLLPSLP